MKKCLIILLTLILAVSMGLIGSGCKEEAAPAEEEAAEEEAVPAEEEAAEEETAPAEGETAEEEAVPAEEDTIKFANVCVSLGDEWLGYGVEAFKLAADMKGVEVQVYDGEWDAERHLSNVEDAINLGVDQIGISIFTLEEAQTFIDLANSAGIPITFENSVLDPSALTGDFVMNVAFDYYVCGYEAMKYVNENWPDQKVFHLRGSPGMGIIEEYQRGVDDAVAEFGNIEIVANMDTDWSTESSMNVMRDFIATGTEFDIVFIHSDEMAAGAVASLVDAGMLDDVKIIVSNGGPTGEAMLRAGEIDAAISIPVSLQSLLMFKAMWLYQQGIEPPEKVMMPILRTVDMSNIEDLISWQVTEEHIDLIGGLDEW